jgi:hypothetical protein
MAMPLVSKDQQKEWQTETDAYVEALRSLTGAQLKTQKTHRKAAP